MTQKRDMSFYTELIIITVVVIVISNVWAHIFKKGIQSVLGDSLFGKLIAAIVITCIGIYFLQKMYGNKNQPYITPGDKLRKSVSKDENEIPKVFTAI